MKPLFDKPCGPLESVSFSGVWKDGTTRAVTCQICGTKHPERDEMGDSYWLGRFCGRQVVADCCGRIYELAYVEMGEEFAVEKLNDIARNPTEYMQLIGHIANCMEKAGKMLSKTMESVEQIICDTDSIRSR